MSLEALVYLFLRIRPASLLDAVKVTSAVAIRLLINSLTLDLGLLGGS
jgi:hypothetical protein